jgi:hypothetical protein
MGIWAIIMDAVYSILFIGVVLFFTKYGFDRAIEKIGKAWLSLILTLIIGPWITKLLERVFIRKAITNAVYNSLIDLVEHNANGYNIAELFAKLPENFVNYLDSLGASLSALEAEFGEYTQASDVIIRTMAERIANPCIELVSTVIGLVIGFVVPYLFFKWLKHEIAKDNKFGFFRFTDKVFGFFVGVAGGYLLVMVLALVAKTFFQVLIAFDAGLNFMPIYEKSYVFRFLGEFDVFGAGRHLLDTVLEGFDSITSRLQ